MQKNRKLNKKQSAELRQPFEQQIIGDYKTQKIIGKGSFGVIYEAVSHENGTPNFTESQKYAIKFEKIPPTTKDGFISQLHKEINILKNLQDLKGFTTLYNFGLHKGNPYMVTSLLGGNLNHLLHKKSGQFDQDTILQIAYQMIDRIAVFHEKGYLHRDIKPENFALGLNENSKILYLIDFGLSKKYIEKKQHIPMNLNKGFIGTARYSSPNAHRGKEQGRRDDLISIGYLLMYFLKGKLPWQGMLVEKSDKKYEAIGKIKEELDYEKYFKGYDPSFISYFKYVLALNFEEKPNYTFLRDLFHKAFVDIKKNKILEKEFEENKHNEDEEDKENSEKNDGKEFFNQIQEIINVEKAINNKANTIAGNIHIPTLKGNELNSRTSTLQPNYDFSNCEIAEEDDESAKINQTYEFFRSINKRASKGENY